jgi:formylmethanofuran dehydrogenase subunit E
MDTPLEMTLRDLFFVVGVATSWLPGRMKESVFQWLCSEMERRVSEELLREAMRDIGFTKFESCVKCNENVADWDFEENEGHVLCEQCQQED